ncbi:DUF397 domain-containing protein [Thermopolyspora sp. NPDC052614]|uniref:DUF397 domain-containing protein n=1 Tax=Thermopolyspora sp. NPDC052614 TaxID=3155682 RepID=UPI003426FFCA
MDLSAVTWRKSHRSGNGANCVEVAVTNIAKTASGRLFLVRDSKKPQGSVLAFTPVEWDAFIGGVKSGEFDHLI